MCNIIRFLCLAHLSCLSCLKRRGNFRESTALSQQGCLLLIGFCFEQDREKGVLKAKPLCFQLLPPETVFTYEPQEVNSRIDSKIRHSGQNSNRSFLHITELVTAKTIALSHLLRCEIRFVMTPNEIFHELDLQTSSPMYRKACCSSSSEAEYLPPNSEQHVI